MITTSTRGTIEKNSPRQVAPEDEVEMVGVKTLRKHIKLESFKKLSRKFNLTPFF